MRIAYLIIAHNEPEQLGQFVARLKADYSDIFIHIDAKKNIADFKQAIPDGCAVTFIEKRLNVNHGGYSLAKAMLELLKAATKDDKYDYYQTLSGLDYPIKNRDSILAKYQSSPDTNYISHYELTDGAPLSQNIYEYHFVDYIAPLPAKLKHYAAKARKIVNKVLGKRKFIKGYTPYRGSQWFAITREAANAVITFLETDEGKRYQKFWRFSWGSDEIFFQTLILHLGFRQLEPYLHYVDWSKDRENPAILDERDLEQLKASPALFARKLTSAKSSTLIQKINQDILGE